MEPPPLTTTPPPPPQPYVWSPYTLTEPKRWQAHPINPDSPPPELTEDTLLAILEHVDAITTWQKCKHVCKAWCSGSRQVLCDLNWLVCQGVSLHALLKRGRPSTPLAVKLSLARPALLNERDADGLLPLQYAAACRPHPELLASLRTLTKGVVPGGLPMLHKAAFAIRRARLRVVQTRLRHAPIPDNQPVAF